jgi:hypothetical protein
MLERKKVLISDCAPGGKSFLRKACLIRRAGVNMQPSKKGSFIQPDRPGGFICNLHSKSLANAGG